MTAGYGTLTNPMEITTALAWENIEPGHNVYVLPGVYTGDFVSLLAGTAEQPITIRSYNSGRSILGGAFVVNGSDVIIRDMEICYSGWATRESAQAGGTPTDIPYTKTLTINAPRVKFINCIIHDLAGLGLWAVATAAEFYGNVIYGLGWLGTDRGHGHSLYTQNNAGTTKTIKHNIMLNSFGWGVHAYSSNGNGVQDLDIIENTCFNAGALTVTPKPNILVGPDSGTSGANINLTGNMTYNGSYGIQFFGGGATGVTLVNNYCPDTIDGTYTATSESGNYESAAVGNQVFLHANTYDANRANLTIYNQAAANTVQVDVSALFGVSGTVKAYNVQDYFTDIQTLTITAGVITVNMQAANRSVAAPVGWDAPAKTFPSFGAFVLIKQ
jgi:hypothetical protein